MAASGAGAEDPPLDARVDVTDVKSPDGDRGVATPDRAGEFPVADGGVACLRAAEVRAMGSIGADYGESTAMESFRRGVRSTALKARS